MPGLLESYYYWHQGEQSAAPEPPAPATYEDGVLTLAPAGYWPCDEASGALADATGNGWSMSKAGAGTMTYQAEGPTIATVAQYAVQTDGACYFTTSAAFPQASATEGLTAAAWVYLPSTSSAAADIVTRYANSSDISLRLRHASDGSALVAAYAAGGSLIAQPAGGDLDGAWKHLIGWWDPSDQDVYVQVDGAAPTSAAGAAGIDTSVSAAWALFGLATGANLLRSGSRLAHVAVWNDVLTSGQRTSLYTGAF